MTACLSGALKRRQMLLRLATALQNLIGGNVAARLEGFPVHHPTARMATQIKHVVTTERSTSPLSLERYEQIAEWIKITDRLSNSQYESRKMPMKPFANPTLDIGAVTSH
jgi:hypothetical protein